MGIQMATSISVSEETRDELKIWRIKGGYSSMDEMLRQMLVEHKKQRLTDISKRFRTRMDELDLTPEDLFE